MCLIVNQKSKVEDILSFVQNTHHFLLLPVLQLNLALKLSGFTYDNFFKILYNKCYLNLYSNGLSCNNCNVIVMMII